MALVLASQSPRRKELLGLITSDFVVDATPVAEEEVTGLLGPDLARELARQKAAGVFARRQEDIVIGCDTIVQAGARLLGKPHSPQEAAEMMQLLSGDSHQVHTGVCIFVPGQSGPADWFCETTTIWMDEIPTEEIQHYITTREPYDKAGGYGIQGWAARFVSRIEGCYYNVMGLPVAHLYRSLLPWQALSIPV